MDAYSRAVVGVVDSIGDAVVAAVGGDVDAIGGAVLAIVGAVCALVGAVPDINCRWSTRLTHCLTCVRKWLLD